MWPESLKTHASSEVEKPRAIRSLGEYDLSATEHVRAFAVPSPDGITSSVCVPYLNGELKDGNPELPRRRMLSISMRIPRTASFVISTRPRVG